MTTPPTPPTCIGTYEHQHPECDGAEAGDACTWRDKCGGFRLHLARTKAAARRWVDSGGRLLVDPYHFDRQCQKWIAIYDVIDGLPVEEATELRRLSVSELFDGFLAYMIAELAEVGRDFAKRGKLALPGDLYLTDQRKARHYVTIYCRATRGKDRPVAKILERPSVKALSIQLPVTATVAAKLTLSARVLLRQGAFKSEISVDERNAEAVANKIVGLVTAGKIKLPPRRRFRK